LLRRIFRLSCGFYFLIGVTSVVLGSLLPQLLTAYNRSYSDGGTLLFLQFLGFLAGVMASPVMSARLGRKRLLILALASIAVGYFVMGFLPDWTWILIMTIAAGFGSGMIESTIGAFTIEFAEEQKAVAMTKLDVYFGVGALLIPALASLYIFLELWRFTFFTLSAMTILLLLLWSKVPGSSSAGIHEAGPAEPGHRKLRYSGRSLRILILFAAFFFVYMGLELGLMNFLPSLFIETIHAKDSAASLSVTILWAAMVIGRLFVGRIAESIRYIPFLFWSAAGTLLLLSAMAVISSEWAPYLLVFGVGLCMSGLFSIALVYANTLLPGQTEKTTSILIASGGIGGAVLQYLIGWSMAQGAAIHTIWLFAGFSAVLLLSIGLADKWSAAHRSVPLIQPGKEL